MRTAALLVTVWLVSLCCYWIGVTVGERQQQRTRPTCQEHGGEVGSSYFYFREVIEIHCADGSRFAFSTE